MFNHSLNYQVRNFYRELQLRMYFLSPSRNFFGDRTQRGKGKLGPSGICPSDGDQIFMEIRHGLRQIKALADAVDYNS